MTPIRAALFDIDGTLYHQLPVRLCMAAEMALHFTAIGAPLALRRQAATLLAFRKVREELRALGHTALSLADLQYEEAAARTAVAPGDVRRLVEEWMLDRPNKYLRYARPPQRRLARRRAGRPWRPARRVLRLSGGTKTRWARPRRRLLVEALRHRSRDQRVQATSARTAARVRTVGTVAGRGRLRRRSARTSIRPRPRPPACAATSSTAAGAHDRPPAR